MPETDDLPPEWLQPRRSTLPQTDESRNAKRTCYPRPSQQPLPKAVKKPFRDIILRSLAPSDQPPTPIETLEVDSLICRLPYKKMLAALCSPDTVLANIPFVTRAYEESFMHEPLGRDQRACVRGTSCEVRSPRGS